MTSRWTLLLLLLVVVGVFVAIAVARQPRETQTVPPPPSPIPTPPRTPFVFPLNGVETAATGARGREAAEEVAAEIQTSLSVFYDRSFMDPLTWTTEPLPTSIWEVFDPSLRDLAAEDAEALSLGEAAASIASLDATRTSLEIRVLLDPKGRPYAAVANAVFRAEGSSTSGEAVEVVSRASFLLRPDGGVWLIVGYPSASTTVDTPTPTSPAPDASSPSPSGSGG